MRAETHRAARLASPTHITQGEKIHKLFAYALKRALLCAASDAGSEAAKRAGLQRHTPRSLVA